MSPVSALMRAEARRCIADAEHAKDEEEKFFLGETAFLLAQIAEDFDRHGVVPRELIKQLNGKVPHLAKSIVSGADDA